VDVFINDWSNSEQRLVARVTLTDGQAIQIQTFGDDRYREVVLRPIEGYGGREITYDDNPVDFFKQLPSAITGSYLGASGPHNGNGPCPWAGETVLPLEPVKQDIAL
jgi:hypothetical protein